ncbi:hypothetical protein ACFP47_09235 [Nesterenkonia lacusekhoensis]|uniref:Uncharacterized protein n=1 Tax=Nesterenkonia lacusekhoensis TaxID=150832 RepID=A0ABS4SYX9_9MICC|nr:hypothetical protein [Nesterenkonia lacusekhoensis]MBP2317400.1 hypothetical protein [Nesterenkonia lacusekhoensis]
MSVPNPLEAIAALISDPAVNVAQGSAPLSMPPALSDFPYVVIWSDLPTRFSGGGFDEPSLSDRPDAFSATVRLTYAATSAASLFWLVNRVRPSLEDAELVIDGYQIGRLRPRSLFPSEIDRTITLEGGISPVYAVDEVELVGTRAKEAS